jgi:hypothetical protein
MKQDFQHRGQVERLSLAEQIEDSMRNQGVNERRLQREIADKQGSFSVPWDVPKND